jgi:hypothetical protein
MVVAALAVVSCGLCAYYLDYARQEFTQEYVTPEFVADQVVARVAVSVPELTPRLTRQAIEYAPRAIEVAEEKLNEMPDQFARAMMEGTAKELDAMMPGVEQELYQSLKAALADARSHRKPGETDEQHVKSVMDALGHVYEEESSKLIKETYAQYRATGRDVVAQLNRLAENKELTRKEELQRQSLVTFLTIASRAKAQQGT